MRLVCDRATCPYGDLRPGAVFGFDLGGQISPIWGGDMERASGDSARFSVCCLNRADVCDFRLLLGAERRCPATHALGLPVRFTISGRRI
jgi:hypothetical protein